MTKEPVRRAFSIIAFALLIVVFGGPALAQEEQEAVQEEGEGVQGERYVKIEEIIVTAQKRAQDVQEVPVSLSTETKEVWNALGQRLGFTPHNYVCGCGAKCTPGLPILDTPETFQVEADS